MIKQESRAYFKALGAHVMALRKARGMTLAELARAIGTSQQAVFAYELGERRISVLVLAKLARIFSTPVGDLVGLSKAVRERKGRLSPRCVRHAERLQALSKIQQRFVVRIIDVLEDSNSRRGVRAMSRPITDELVYLKQAVDLLKVAEDLVQPENVENYPGAIASVIRSARTLVEEVIEVLAAHFAKR